MIFIKTLAVFGGLCLIGLLFMIVVFGPETYRFVRDEYRGQFPFDWPVWAYRLRSWWRKHIQTIEGILFSALIAGLLWLGLIVVGS